MLLSALSIAIGLLIDRNVDAVVCGDVRNGRALSAAVGGLYIGMLEEDALDIETVANTAAMSQDAANRLCNVQDGSAKQDGSVDLDPDSVSERYFDVRREVVHTL